MRPPSSQDISERFRSTRGRRALDADLRRVFEGIEGIDGVDGVETSVRPGCVLDTRNGRLLRFPAVCLR